MAGEDDPDRADRRRHGKTVPGFGKGGHGHAPAAGQGDPGRHPRRRRLGGSWEFQYRRVTMRTHRQRQATTLIVMLAVLLGSLWAGGLTASATDQAAELATGRSLPSVEAAIPPDRAQGLRPLAERPDPGGRLLPLLLGLLAASVMVTQGVRAGRRRSGPARPRSLTSPAPRRPRAPPFLQPA